MFQLSPLPAAWLADLPGLFERISAMLRAPALAGRGGAGAVVAVQVRDAALLTPHFAALLREAGATYCLGLHARMPPIEDQLPMLRALWPARWCAAGTCTGATAPTATRRRASSTEPYTQIADADLRTRQVLAKVALATVAAGRSAFITIGNKAEGCAPLSVIALAEEIAAQGPTRPARPDAAQRPAAEHLVDTLSDVAVDQQQFVHAPLGAVRSPRGHVYAGIEQADMRQKCERA